MRKIGKVLVVGLVLAEVAFGVYLLSPKSDPATRKPGAVAGDDTTLAADTVQSGTLRATAGNAASAPPPGANMDDAARVPTQSVEGHIAPAAAPSPAQVPRQLAEPHPQTRQTPQTPALVAAPAPAPAPAAAPTESKTAAVPPTGHGREGLRRRDSTSVSTAATDELVKESAKLDPALPPPQPEPFVHDDQPHRGSNAVAAAMTQQLVKESARLDPALPPPNPSGVH
jgi:hypothetical protein